MSKKLVLIGGGHSHGIVLKQWGINPIPGVELTLITDVVYTPYSGMLPGYIAGFYEFNQCHINLQALCQFSGSKMILDRAIGLDLVGQKVRCENCDLIDFDVLSINMGSTPNIDLISGGEKYAIPVKPVPQFLTRWNELLRQQESQPKTPLKIAVVGGGAGGVELILNMQTRLQQIPGNRPQLLDLHLFHRGQEVLSGYNSWVRQRLQKILIKRNIQLHLSETVIHLESLSERILMMCESGFIEEFDYVFWGTEASPLCWLKEGGLTTDSRGFILVNNALQSLSHPQVFAAGDVATMVNYPRPKAGVFAVRQGLPLYHNLCRFLQSQPLHAFRPQKQYLSLISTGDKRAIASRSFWGFDSPLMWYWKDFIDRQFIRQLTFESSVENRN